VNYTLYQVARQLCICLYWIKFNEDRTIYFDRVADLYSKIKRTADQEMNRARAGTPLSEESESDEESDSDSDQEEGLNQLTQFLLEYYRGLTPHVFDKQSH